MAEPLAIYLEDHLAGALLAVELIEAIRDGDTKPDLREFAARLLDDVQQDRRVLQSIGEHFGVKSGSMKDLGGWVSEKMARLKLKHDSGNELGLFEALEFLTLGVAGKHALWRMLSLLSDSEPRLQSVDYESLMSRAADQHSKLEERRLRVGFSSLSCH